MPYTDPEKQREHANAKQRDRYANDPVYAEGKRIHSRQYQAGHKEERSLTQRQYRETHLGEIQEKDRQYRQSNTEELKKKNKVYRDENAEVIKQRRRTSRLANRDHVNARQRAYYATHPIPARQYQREYRIANGEKKKAQDRNYTLKHPEVRRAASAKHRAAKRNAPLNDFTHAQWIEMQAVYEYRCAYCHRRAKGHLTQDHLTPLSKGGSHTASNIVPACQPCNSKKGTGAVLVPIQPLLLTIAPPQHKKTTQ